MDIAFIAEAANLGATVFTVVAFLWYLSKLLNIQIERDRAQVEALNRQTDSNIALAKALQSLTDIVSRSVISTGKGKVAVDKNTDAVDKNTEKRLK